MPLTYPTMPSVLQLLKKLNDRLTDNYFFISKSISFIGWLAFFSHPVFYITWQYYEQPYESIFLRSVGSILSLFVIYRNKFPGILQSRFPIFWFLYITYTLPFFHSFNFLMNDFNDMWMMATVIASLLVVVLLDVQLAILSFIIGCSSAFLLYSQINDTLYLPPIQHYFLPVLGYAIITGIVIHAREAGILADRRNAAFSIAGKFAHELRTPLMTIQATAMALENPFTRDDPTIIEDLESASTNMLKIIEMVLMISRDPQSVKHGFISIDINQSTKDTIDNYPYVGENDRHMVSFEPDPIHKTLIVHGDAILFQHVILNLLKNALLFAKRGGSHVEISTKLENNTIIICVSDDGPGVSDHMQLLIFDQYVTTGSKEGGSGLGLSFSQTVVRLMDGDIKYSKSHGWSSTFMIELPEKTSVGIP